MVKSIKKDKLTVNIYENRTLMGEAAANDIASKLEGKTVVIKAKAGANGKLFGSITSGDIADALKMQGHIVVDKRKMRLDEPIRSIGTTKVKIKLHQDVTAELTVIVTEAK